LVIDGIQSHHLEAYELRHRSPADIAVLESLHGFETLVEYRTTQTERCCGLLVDEDGAFDRDH
jgi:hypothetical protein